MIRNNHLETLYITNGAGDDLDMKSWAIFFMIIYKPVFYTQVGQTVFISKSFCPLALSFSVLRAIYSAEYNHSIFYWLRSYHVTLPDRFPLSDCSWYWCHNLGIWLNFGQMLSDTLSLIPILWMENIFSNVYCFG